MTGLEFEATKNLTALVIKVVWEQGGKLVKTLDKRTQNLIFKASQQYIQKYTERHGQLKVLGMQEPVTLESVYTAVQFLDNTAIHSFESISRLEEVFRQAKNRGFRLADGVKHEGIEVVNNKQYLMVLGGPGSGKSTFLRKMGLESLKGKRGIFQHLCIPVFVELKSFNPQEINIKELIAEELKICGFPYAEESALELMDKGNLLFLLDGLDEVSTNNLNETINQIQNFVDKYEKNRFIASCRTAAYRHNFRRFTDVVMADFDDTQIEQFILNWFGSKADKEAGTAQKCWEILKKPENCAAKELAHTPLLLTFLCLVYNRSQNFPDNRSILYRKALRILLEEWAAEKRILQDKIYQGLNTELEEILLSKIACQNFELNQLFFTKREIVEEIKSFLASNLNAPKELDGEAVLNAIAIQQGILVERAEGVFSFSHLTLQEYLTAQYIDDQRQIEKLVATYLTEQRWKEVFLQVAGLMRGGADELLLLIEKATQKYINTPKLQALLTWVNQVTTGSVGDIKPAAKRTAAIFLFLTLDLASSLALDPDQALVLALDIAFAHDCVLDARAFALVHAFALASIFSFDLTHYFLSHTQAFDLTGGFEKIKVFNKSVNFNVLIARLEVLKAQLSDTQQPLHRAVRERVVQTWFNTLRLNSDLIYLSEEEIEALKNYLYANSLLVQCKQAAVRISPTTWEAIEKRMLLVQ
ncbi:histidine kinase [Scytonema hofmannii PCC 7110]|uniref:Histidine kinase n=1 Tax=Scytonema hofmannii PCC 7110 TaxID=128403 RepID=A0A139WQ45_9CYAN|nr:NACHT domain-containing protein [Scytonema hofmannii]KYC34553.1 histidine kinase [Scytonema hofmannii PCC 7110]